jgi:hypothetical protein
MPFRPQERVARIYLSDLPERVGHVETHRNFK